MRATESPKALLGTNTPRSRRISSRHLTSLLNWSFRSDQTTSAHKKQTSSVVEFRRSVDRFRDWAESQLERSIRFDFRPAKDRMEIRVQRRRCPRTSFSNLQGEDTGLRVREGYEHEEHVEVGDAGYGICKRLLCPGRQRECQQRRQAEVVTIRGE